MGYVKCSIITCDNWFEINEKLPVSHESNQLCARHIGTTSFEEINAISPESFLTEKQFMQNNSPNLGNAQVSLAQEIPIKSRIPQRRCIYLDDRGMQCDKWFDAIDENKLCAAHQEIVSPSTRNGQTEEQKTKYIDLVNDERRYCYHFQDGTAQNQDQKLIYEFKDDEDGTVYEKIDRHIAFLEKVLEDVKARLQSGARAVRNEKLSLLSEEERKRLREIKIERVTKESAPKRLKTERIKNEWKEKLSSIGASIDMDPDEMIARFKAMKAAKESAQKENL